MERAKERDVPLQGRAFLMDEAGEVYGRVQLPDLGPTDVEPSCPSLEGWRRVAPSRQKAQPGDLVAMQFGTKWVYGRLLAQAPEVRGRDWVFVIYRAVSDRRDDVPDLAAAPFLFGPSRCSARHDR